MDFLDLAKVVSQLGVMPVLVLYFVYHSMRREKQLAQRIAEVESFNNSELMELITDMKLALADSARAIEANTEVMRRLGHQSE
ncbi:hypothetical protein Mal52_27870 [Symmachiella dynata]|uniref:Uncharacterized protein n=1 Tax=Symmachiella dynata TaxID=2527995 RepID=A0A517ZP99_9PLAN|nr:hypothetical protein [Symmachiella dynata]QDU44308.1 hypothetical protein Mal52_27870 [Symmachiella dynata]